MVLSRSGRVLRTGAVHQTNRRFDSSNMKSSIHTTLAALLLGFVAAHGQSNNNNGRNGSAPAGAGGAANPSSGQAGRQAAENAAWQTLMELTGKHPEVSTNLREARSGQRRADDAIKVATRAGNAAAAARSFYTEFPGGNREREARKIEAVYSLREAALGDDNAVNAAKSIARRFANDRDQRRDDRIDVELALGKFRISQGKRNSPGGDWDEQIEMLDEIRSRYGESNQVTEALSSIAARSPHPHAQRAARLALRDNGLSRRERDQMQSVVELGKKVGSKPDLLVSTPNRGQVDPVGDKGAKSTVLVVWPAGRAQVLEPWLVPLKALAKRGDLVLVSIGASSGVVASASDAWRGVGKHFWVSPGAETRSFQRSLEVHVTPYIYIYIFHRLVA